MEQSDDRLKRETAVILTFGLGVWIFFGCKSCTGG